MRAKAFFKTRCSRVASLVAAGIGLLVIGVWWAQPDCRISKDYYFKIRHGMQRAEVVQLLGCQPGDYSSGRVELWFSELRRTTVPGTPQDWITDEVKVTVWLNDEGKVTESVLLYNVSWRPSRWRLLVDSWGRKLGS